MQNLSTRIIPVGQLITKHHKAPQHLTIGETMVIHTMLSKTVMEDFQTHGGVGGYTAPPCTTKRRTTNLKTKTNQN